MSDGSEIHHLTKRIFNLEKEMLSQRAKSFQIIQALYASNLAMMSLAKFATAHSNQAKEDAFAEFMSRLDVVDDRLADRKDGEDG
ncbi:hypothetical protein [Yoonia vestfoldensis]|uniref:hypothetical protein n=1 Tax=Yoonia vestfoldensis TaxID=245188 RepID=UPI0012FFC579|nr:hypothetical protein [Yoonia vestfoldensis]